MDILPVFCDIDDFCQLFEPLFPKWLLSSCVKYIIAFQMAGWMRGGEDWPHGGDAALPLPRF